MAMVWTYWNWVITRWAETGFVPPVKGVIVDDVGLSAGFLTVKIESICVVVIMLVPILYVVPVVRPTTV